MSHSNVIITPNGNTIYVCRRGHLCPLIKQPSDGGFQSVKALNSHYLRSRICSTGPAVPTAVVNRPIPLPSEDAIPVTNDFSGLDFELDDDDGDAAMPTIDVIQDSSVAGALDTLLQAQEAEDDGIGIDTAGHDDGNSGTGDDGTIPPERKIGMFRHLHPRAPDPIRVPIPVDPSKPAETPGDPAAGPPPSSPFDPWREEADFLISVHLRRSMSSNAFNQYIQLVKACIDFSLGLPYTANEPIYSAGIIIQYDVQHHTTQVSHQSPHQLQEP